MNNKNAATLYHITDSFKTALQIFQQGLKPSPDGYIYLLTSKDVTDYVALNQLGYTTYALLKIKPIGIKGVLEPDLVGEITARFQVRVKQPLIERDYLGLVGVYNIKTA